MEMSDRGKRWRSNAGSACGWSRCCPKPDSLIGTTSKESRSRIFLLGAAGEQEENGLGASASGPARTLTQNVPLGSRVVSQKVNFLGQGNKGGLISSAVRRRTGEYPPARLLLPGGLEPRVLTTLYSFCAQSGCPDGDGPSAGVIQATNGNLYGTTAFGGANAFGTIFELTMSGTLTTRYSFCGAAETSGGCKGTSNSANNGYDPVVGLVQATDGDFYGTTFGGGANVSACPPNTGGGTVFKITPRGKLTTLYSFCSQSGGADGYDPVSTLVQARNGDFYGTTRWGGDHNDGTVFRLSAH